MPERNVVIRSIESPDGLRCVDIFRRPDGGFGFAEYRRDPEDPSGWHPTGRQVDKALTNPEATLSEARRHLPWLAELPDRQV